MVGNATIVLGCKMMGSHLPTRVAPQNLQCKMPSHNSYFCYVICHSYLNEQNTAQSVDEGNHHLVCFEV